MTRRRHEPLDTVLDVVLYAPIGAFFHGPEVVDEMAERGRRQVANARVVGQVALARGRERAEQVATDAQQRLADALVAAARATGAPFAGSEPPPTPEATDEPRGEATPPGTATPLRVVADDAPVADDLPIPGYDTLSASQVVPRLDDLAGDELEAVRTYEQTHRGRMTILSRIAQLQAS